MLLFTLSDIAMINPSCARKARNITMSARRGTYAPQADFAVLILAHFYAGRLMKVPENCYNESTEFRGGSG
jgi:hypothetical protein